MQLEAKEKKKKWCGAKLVNAEEPSEQVVKSNGGSKTETEIFIPESNVWGPQQDHSLER